MIPLKPTFIPPLGAVQTTFHRCPSYFSSYPCTELVQHLHEVPVSYLEIVFSITCYRLKLTPSPRSQQPSIQVWKSGVVVMIMMMQVQRGCQVFTLVQATQAVPFRVEQTLRSAVLFQGQMRTWNLPVQVPWSLFWRQSALSKGLSPWNSQISLMNLMKVETISGVIPEPVQFDILRLFTLLANMFFGSIILSIVFS